MHRQFKQRKRLRNAQVLALLTWSAMQAFAQSPALETDDSWIRFPPRPKTAPSGVQMPTPAQRAEPAPLDEAKRPAKAKRLNPGANAQPPSAALPPSDTPDNPPQQAWIRFPVVPSRPSAVVAAPAAPDTSASEPAAPATPVAGPALKKRAIVGFTVVGNERVSSSEILELLSHQRGQNLNNETLRQATDAVSDLYQRKGILALVEMPAQDLTEGWAQIKITEAKFAGVVVEDPKGALANRPNLPVAMVEHVQPKGALMSLPALDQASALMNEVPGVDIKLSLRPGEQAGQTQAVAIVDQGKPIEGTVGIDNAGAQATGELRESAKLTLNNPLKIGDSATIQLLHSKGMDYQRANYSVPVGGAGWRVGVNASNSSYQVVTPGFEYLNARGPSHTTGVDLTIPLQRSAQDTLTLQLGADRRKFRNEALDVVQSDYRGSTVSAYLEGSHREGVQAETSASLQWVSGHIDLSGSTPAHQYGDSVTTQTEGNYSKARFALTHRQDLDASNTLQASLLTQWASKNLDGSEKFFLGGANGVRAYPTNEAGGSLGQLLSMEWQRHFTVDQRPMTAAGFYDTGRIVINKYNNFATAASPNNYGLSGAGFWLGTNIHNRYGLTSLRFTAARRLGSNDGAPPATGLDQDGTRVLNRYRFSLTQTF